MRLLLGALLVSTAVLAACGSGGGGGGPTPGPTDTPGGPTRTPTTTRTPGQGQAKALYVRATGDDKKSGTSPDTAVQTINRAVHLVSPGSTVYVGPGHYVGRTQISGITPTAAAPVLFIADTTGVNTGDPPGDVVLDAAGDTVTVLITKAPYVTLDGFIMIGAMPQTMPAKVSATGVQVRSASTHVTIRNCVVRNSGPADGIRVDSSNDVLIFNNLLVENDRGIAISGASANVQVINNTIANNQRTGIAVKQKGGVAPSGTTVNNNIFQASANRLAINIDQGPPSALGGYVGDFNLVFEPGAGDQSASYSPAGIRGADDINEDAQFVDADNGDFHLEPNSPALNAGTDSIDPALLDALQQGSTTADGSADVSPVDLGYHYPR